MSRRSFGLEGARVPGSGRRAMTGMGLVELMIAMVLGLIVMGAAFAVFMSNQSTFRASEGLNRVQENARIAFELMSRDVRAAGGSACSSASLVEDTGAQSQQYRDAPVAGSESELIVRSGDDTAYRVVASTASSVDLDADQIADARDAFNEDDVLLLCNARKTFVVQATGVSGTRVAFDALPGGYSPADDEFAPPTAVVLARYRDVRWFVADNGRDTGRSLYVSRMGGDREEVAEGVHALTLQYLNGDTNAYVDSPAGANITAVRMTLTLRGNEIDGQTLERQASHVVSMRSRTL